MSKEALGIWLPRFIAPFVAWLVGWAAQKGVTLNEGELITLMLGVYGGVHKLLSNKMNPGDAAAGPVVVAEKAEVARAEH